MKKQKEKVIKKKKKSMSTKFKVVNVVAVQNCGFSIDMNKIYNCGYIKYFADETSHYSAIVPPKATKQITFFHQGNMITLGNKSIAEAKRNLLIAKNFFKKYKAKRIVLEEKK